jgi:UDP-N-acetylglucosamine:LPS N-acetylglucosamine transferase
LDLLDLLPARLGPLLRRSYEGMLRLTPWLYDAIFWAFFLQHRGFEPTVSPLSRIAGAAVRQLVGTERPDAVLSTFHMAGEVTGRLRARGELPMPSVVVVTESSLHRLWLHSGNDLYVCPYPATAVEAAARTGRPALVSGPVVDPRFREPQDRAAARAELGLRAGERAVLVSTGSWGVGDVEEVVRLLAASGGYVPIALCGRNEALRRRLDEVIDQCRLAPGSGAAGSYVRGIALGWRDDMPAVMAAASALVDNAGGLTCMEAFAAGVPVVSFRPLPGHGRHGVRALADLGLATVAEDGPAMLTALEEVTTDGPARESRLRTAEALFTDAPGGDAGAARCDDPQTSALIETVECAILARTTPGAA